MRIRGLGVLECFWGQRLESSEIVSKEIRKRIVKGKTWDLANDMQGTDKNSA